MQYSPRTADQPTVTGRRSLPVQSVVEDSCVRNATSGTRSTDLTKHQSSHCSRQLVAGILRLQTVSTAESPL